MKKGRESSEAAKDRGDKVASGKLKAASSSPPTIGLTDHECQQPPSFQPSLLLFLSHSSLPLPFYLIAILLYLATTPLLLCFILHVTFLTVPSTTLEAFSSYYDGES